MRGFCPICGAIPPIGAITGEQGERTLFCVYCGMDWYYPELRCPFCGGSEQQRSSYRYLEHEKSYRIEICTGCNKYLKIVDAGFLGFTLPLDVENIATLHLDILAQKQGYQRGAFFPLLI